MPRSFMLEISNMHFSKYQLMYWWWQTNVTYKSIGFYVIVQNGTCSSFSSTKIREATLDAKNTMSVGLWQSISLARIPSSSPSIDFVARLADFLSILICPQRPSPHTCILYMYTYHIDGSWWRYKVALHDTLRCSLNVYQYVHVRILRF